MGISLDLAGVKRHSSIKAYLGKVDIDLGRPFKGEKNLKPNSP